MNDNIRKEKIFKKYPNITLNDAKIITSYTCEAKQHSFSPYLILNKNLVKDDRKQGIENISKYFYILLMALRKLPRYYPDKQLYRCISKKVMLYNPSNKKFIPYEIGNQKTFWAFTSTSIKFEESYKFLGKNNNIDDDEFKTGTIFSLSGNIWGYDITVLSCYEKEEEIILEPERKYIIKEVIPNVNDIIIIRGEFEDTPIVLKEIKLTNELIYKVDYGCFRPIFGYMFFVNNTDNIELIINGKHSYLNGVYYDLKKGDNSIKLIIKNKITNLSWMFAYIDKDIKYIELKNLDVSTVENFQCMFYDCTWMSNLNGLAKWNVSKGKHFKDMFSGCSSLSDITALQNWNVSSGINFGSMFHDCTSLSDIYALKNWNVSNGTEFDEMFKGCLSLSELKALQNWNVFNGINFTAMFYNCVSLSDINGLKKWNTSNGKEFSYIFGECKSLSDIKALQNWNVSNGINFYFMFTGCPLSDKKQFDNWRKVNKYLEDNPEYFKGIFDKNDEN